MSNYTNKVYVVTDRDDAIDVEIFSTRELAEEVAKCNEYSRVLEYQLDPYADRFNSGMKPYYAAVNRDGDAHCHLSPPTSNDDDTPRFSWHGGWEGRNEPKPFLFLICYCWAKSEKEVMEIIHNEHARLIANGEWNNQLNSMKHYHYP